MVEKQKLQVAIIVQARIGSTRLPGKVMMSVLGRPLLSFLLERLYHCKMAQTIMVATSTNPLDHSIVGFCEDQNVACFAGSEENVLERYVHAARACGADVIVRVTADCPLLDPSIVDRVIDTFISEFPHYDYVSNVVHRSFARGMDVEVFSTSCLERIYKSADKEAEKEHVTLHILHHPEQYHIGSVTAERDSSQYRLTVDTEEDYKLVKLILEELYPTHPAFTLHDIIALLECHPEWVKINAHIEQKFTQKDEDA